MDLKVGTLIKTRYQGSSVDIYWKLCESWYEVITLGNDKLLLYGKHFKCVGVSRGVINDLIAGFELVQGENYRHEVLTKLPEGIVTKR